HALSRRPRPPQPSVIPYTPLFRSRAAVQEQGRRAVGHPLGVRAVEEAQVIDVLVGFGEEVGGPAAALAVLGELPERFHDPLRRADRKSTRLNSSHQIRSYAVLCST